MPAVDVSQAAAGGGDPEVLGPVLAETERFCRAELDAAAVDHDAAIPRRVLDGLAGLGLFGVTLPEAFGGADLPLASACKVVDTIAAFDRSVAVSLGLHLGLGTRGLVRYGSAAQHERYLPSLAEGSRIAAFSTTEAGAGSDLSSLRTQGRVDGEHLVVSGEKIYVTNGGFAGLYTLAVSTPGLGGAQRGQSVVLVERGDPGFSVLREEKKLGLKGSSTTGLLLEDVRLPLDRVLGEAGQGAKMLQHILSWGRTLMSAGCCGTAREAIRRAMDHVTTRRQFGRSLSALEVVREKLARMRAKHFAMEALVDEVAREPEETLAVRSLAAKVFSSEQGWLVVDAALQLHGGSGFIEETGLAVMLRDLRVTRIFEGANDVLLAHLGAHELGRAAVKPGPASALAEGPSATLSPLQQEASQLEAQVDAWRRELLATYKLAVFRNPRLLHQLGQAVVWREAVGAATRRALRVGDPEAAALARTIMSEARHEVARVMTAPLDKALVEAALGDFPPGETR